MAEVKWKLLAVALALAAQASVSAQTKAAGDRSSSA